MDSMLFLKASTATAMLGAAILAMLFLFLARRFGFRYLRLWAFSFLAAAGYQAFALAGLILVGIGLPATDPARLLSSMLSQALGFNQLLLLLAGVWEFTGGKPFSTRSLRTGVLAMTGLGLLTTLAFAFDPQAEASRLLLRVGLRYLSAGSAFLLAAMLVARRLRHSDAQAARLVSLAFLGYGMAQLLVLSIFAWQLLHRSGSAAGQVFGLLDLLFQTLLGAMLAMWLLDRERRRAVAAQLRVHTLEHFDPITALPNRDHFIALGGELVRVTRPAKLLLLDLDGLRPMQESLADSQPDRLLVQVSGRLAALLPVGTLLGRLRADELGALLPLDAQAENASSLGQRIFEAFRQPFWLEERALLLSVRVGLADFPADAPDLPSLLALAERTLAQADSAESRVVQVRVPAAGERPPQLADLHHAVVHGDMELYYQPILRRDGQLSAFEALLRWRLADGRLLTPEDFLSAMRQSGFTAALDARVIEMALLQLAEWQSRWGPGIRIAVNLSPASLREVEFVPRLLTRLAELQIVPHSLELEITETAALSRPTEVMRWLEQLRAGGVELSLDDFGTGFSALTHLRCLPVHRIKVDRSFVAGLPHSNRDVAIVQALTTLAHALQLEVTAEGVENLAQQRFLDGIGVDAQQGYLHARPMPAGQVPVWLGLHCPAFTGAHADEPV